MSDPVVSVVIPLFNKEEFIETTLNSVVAQNYKNIEVIVIDDSSTDSSFNLVKDFFNSHQERFIDIKLRSRPNTGQAGTRNEGISLASGEFIAFLDADDVWHPEKLTKQVDYLKNNEAVDLVFCNYFMIFNGSSKVKAVRLSPVEKKIEAWLLTTGYGGLLESTGMARKESLLSLGGFDSNLQMCGGLDLSFRFKDSNKAGCVDEYLCAYRVTTGGWHNNKSDLVQSYESLLAKQDLYGQFENRVRNFLRIHLLIWQIRNGFKGIFLIELFSVMISNPINFAYYVFATTWRVFVASIRGYLKRKSSKYMRKVLIS